MSQSFSRQVVIVTPALADANNGNWQTARRWATLLRGHHRVRLAARWHADDAEAARDEALLALHARRSAASIDAWHAARGPQGLAVVLTGTDLYQDIDTDAAAQRSLEQAGVLVGLQDLAARRLPAGLRGKVRTILQSTGQRATLPKTDRHLRAVAVGHLRAVKDPLTLMAAARLINPTEGILIDHLGAALEPELAAAAQATMAASPHYRWLGPVSHVAALRRIQRAHVLVHPSRLEGGAHVVMEALRSGTPVLASAMDGNLGLLGEDYAGTFPVGDAAALAAGLRQLRSEQRAGDAGTPPFTTQLMAQCAQRAPLFEPARERDALLKLIDDLAPPRAHASL